MMNLNHFGETKVNMSRLHEDVCSFVQNELKTYNINTTISKGKAVDSFAIDVKLNELLVSMCYDDISLMKDNMIISYHIDDLGTDSDRCRLFLRISQDQYEKMTIRMNDSRFDRENMSFMFLLYVLTGEYWSKYLKSETRIETFIEIKIQDKHLLDNIKSNLKFFCLMITVFSLKYILSPSQNDVLSLSYLF